MQRSERRRYRRPAGRADVVDVELIGPPGGFVGLAALLVLNRRAC